MANGIADSQVLPSFAVKQDGQQLVGNDLLDDFGNVGQELVEVERVGSGSGDFQQKIEQLRTLAEAHTGFARSGLHGLRRLSQAEACATKFKNHGHWAAASTMAMLELAPIRVAPAATMARKSSRVRMPPAAFTPISGPTTCRISATSWAVAPAGPNPVDVFTKSARAMLARVQAT